MPQSSERGEESNSAKDNQQTNDQFNTNIKIEKTEPTEETDYNNMPIDKNYIKLEITEPAEETLQVVPIEYSNSPVDTDKNFGAPWTSPKREVCDSSDQVNFLHVQVGLDTSVREHEVDSKPIISVDVPDFSDCGSTANSFLDITPSEKLTSTGDRKFIDQIKIEISVNPDELVNERALSTSTVAPEEKNNLTRNIAGNTCDLCNLLCKSKRGLAKHLNKCDPLKNRSKHFANKNYLRTPKEEKVSYACNYCDFKSTSGFNFTLHLRKHTGEKPFECDTCGLKYSNKQFLRNHIHVKHKGQMAKPSALYACSVCNCKYKQASYLKIHMRMHTGEKPFTCDICDNKFGHLSSLRKHHKRIHSGPRLTKARQQFLNWLEENTHLGAARPYLPAGTEAAPSISTNDVP